MNKNIKIYLKDRSLYRADQNTFYKSVVTNFSAKWHGLCRIRQMDKRIVI